MPTKERRLMEQAKRQIVVGTDLDLFLAALQGQAEALRMLGEVLRTDKRLYRDIELWLMRLQRGKEGPLTDWFTTVVGRDNSIE